MPLLWPKSGLSAPLVRLGLPQFALPVQPLISTRFLIWTLSLHAMPLLESS